jgi:hypothetical protein
MRCDEKMVQPYRPQTTIWRTRISCWIPKATGTHSECVHEMKNQQMSLFQFYSYIDGSLHVSGPQAHPQENSHSCSHNQWFSGCTNACVNSCVNSPEDGPVGPKHVEIRRYMNKIKIVTSVGFSFHMLNGCTVQKD